MTHHPTANVPGTATRTAKNVHAAPGLPNQPLFDYSGRNPMVAALILREHNHTAPVVGCPAAVTWECTCGASFGSLNEFLAHANSH